MMLNSIRAIVVAVLMAAGILSVPSPGHAAARPVYVQTYSVPSSWPVTSSVDWVDRYTGTNMIRGTCRSGYKCIKIRYKTINNSWSAITYGDVTCRSCTITIYLNPKRSHYHYYTKRSIIDHELGHANGITWHNTRCTSRMYHRVFCPNGSRPPRVFTASEKARLRVH